MHSVLVRSLNPRWRIEAESKAGALDLSHARVMGDSAAALRNAMSLAKPFRLRLRRVEDALEYAARSPSQGGV